jgi:hypothetical protein
MGWVMRVPLVRCAGALMCMVVLSSHLASAGPLDDPRSDLEPILSPAAKRVSEIAWQNGDRRFVLVDKAHGRIFLFQNGKLTFDRPALTGESMADQFPPDAMYKPVSQHVGVKYKVTPAGRFTLTRGHDDSFGETFDINELQGSDWMIAVHQVWLGIRSQHRDARLLSADDRDKHITEGCIDVDPATITQLSRLMPHADGTAIYILPTDESSIDRLFAPHPPAVATIGSTNVMHVRTAAMKSRAN